MRPSSPCTAPAPVRIATPDSGALASPTCSSASSAARWMPATPASVRGRYWPPSNPARTGRKPSANGAARSAVRAARPPERRLRTGAQASSFMRAAFR
jgi:hypothetical protein